MKLAVVLLNLGAPDSMDAVEPFLRNLFSDPAIIRLPGFLRRPLADVIARRRAPVTRGMYERIGGRSPLLAETEAQAQALEEALSRLGAKARCFIAMRHWRPFTEDAVEAVQQWRPEYIVLLPLYPQYSTTTTQSAFEEWSRAAREAGLAVPAARVCCYPWAEGFVRAEAELVWSLLAKRKPGLEYRALFSAHGLPERIVQQGDPYRWQVEKTVAAIVARLPEAPEYVICYQSRVGPMKWIGPTTEEEVRRAGYEGKGAVVIPISFVSEHSETLVELDLDYGERVARAAGVPDYIRVPTVRTHGAFIGALAELVLRAQRQGATITCERKRICPASLSCAIAGG
ncbi:MAG: ferrochelatase [Alphaproteobacteria bacterium]